MTTENNTDEGANLGYETDLLNVGPRPFPLRDGWVDFCTTGMEHSGVCASTWHHSPLNRFRAWDLALGNSLPHFFVQ